MRKLPPFPELVAFEAVARHLSFTKAARELFITQSAVSHRVRRLEKFFGTQLIRRLNPGIKLSAAGQGLLPELSSALESLARLGERESARNERRLRVAAGSGLCNWWLTRRLPAFMSAHPGISVEIVPLENDATSIPHVDIRILWVDAGHEPATPTQAPLFAEYVFPVCSPRLLPGKRTMKNREALNSLPLLHKTAHAQGEWSWPVWFERLGVDRKSSKKGELRFADTGLLVSAAVDGAGVALTRSLLAYDALVSGTLVVPIAGFEPMVLSKKHVARWRRDRADDPDIKAFVDWIVAEAAVTIAKTNEIVRTRQTVK